METAVVESLVSMKENQYSSLKTEIDTNSKITNTNKIITSVYNFVREYGPPFLFISGVVLLSKYS